jgi:hypothetical protein
MISMSCESSSLIYIFIFAFIQGLCQAKIAAAELWRKYSENYRSHQARHTPPGGGVNGRRSQRTTAVSAPQLEECGQSNQTRQNQQPRRQLDYSNSMQFDDEDEDDDTPSRTSCEDKSNDRQGERFRTNEREIQESSMELDAEDRNVGTSRVVAIDDQRKATTMTKDRGSVTLDIEQSVSNDDTNDNHTIVMDEDDSTADRTACPTTLRDDCLSSEYAKKVSGPSSLRNAKRSADCDGSRLNENDVAMADDLSDVDSNLTIPTKKENDKVLSGADCGGREQNNNVVGLKMSHFDGVVRPEMTLRPSSCSGDVEGEDDGSRLKLSSSAVADTAEIEAVPNSPSRLRSPAINTHGFVSHLSAVASGDRPEDAAAGCVPPPLKMAKRSSSIGSSANQRQHGRKLTDSAPTSNCSSPTAAAAAAADYRRSERGLSFLFPSFADHHGMSLIDKVSHSPTVSLTQISRDEEAKSAAVIAVVSWIS